MMNWSHTLKEKQLVQTSCILEISCTLGLWHSCIYNIRVKHNYSACGEENTRYDMYLVCGIIPDVQVSCIMVFYHGVWVVSLVWYNGIPRAKPKESYYTTFRVQYPYTIENHAYSTTVTWHLCHSVPHNNKLMFMVDLPWVDLSQWQ